MPFKISDMNYPTDLFTAKESLNPPINLSEQHKIRGSTYFEALEL